MFSTVPAFNVDVKKTLSLFESDNFKGRYSTSKRRKIKKNTLYLNTLKALLGSLNIDILMIPQENFK